MYCSKQKNKTETVTEMNVCTLQGGSVPVLRLLDGAVWHTIELKPFLVKIQVGVWWMNKCCSDFCSLIWAANQIGFIHDHNSGSLEPIFPLCLVRIKACPKVVTSVPFPHWPLVCVQLEACVSWVYARLIYWMIMIMMRGLLCSWCAKEGSRTLHSSLTELCFDWLSQGCIITLFH